MYIPPIVSKPSSKEYQDGWERTFGEHEPKPGDAVKECDDQQPDNSPCPHPAT